MPTLPEILKKGKSRAKFWTAFNPGTGVRKPEAKLFPGIPFLPDPEGGNFPLNIEGLQTRPVFSGNFCAFSRLRRDSYGFTLIEMSVVVAIIGILYLTVVPMYGTTIIRAKETALKENLHVLRKTCDLYYKDHQFWPESLNALVKEGYIRAIPVDPFSKSQDTWTTLPSEPGKNDVFDVHSGYSGKSLDGPSYSTW